MPYEKDGNKFNRVTEIAGYVECEALAWIDQNTPMDIPKKGNVVTLPGTITHHKIAENELKEMKNPYKRIDFEWGEQEKQMFERLLSDHKSQKEVQRSKPDRFKHMSDLELMSKYEKLMEDVRFFYSNYTQFCIDEPHKAIFVEEKIWDDGFKVAGTVDLIGIFRLKGRIVKREAHPYFDVGEKEYFVEDLNGDWMDVVTISDWKTSKRKMKAHEVQMSIYHLIWERSGKLDRLREKGYIINSQTFSILLGEKKPTQKAIAMGLPTAYQFIKYEVDTAPFLASLEIREAPRPVTKDLEGNDGLKGRCMFCSYIMYCPDNEVTSSYEKGTIYSTATPFNDRDTSVILLMFSELDNATVNPTKHKIQALHEEIKKRRAVSDDKSIEDRVLEDAGIEKTNPYNLNFADIKIDDSVPKGEVHLQYKGKTVSKIINLKEE